MSHFGPETQALLKELRGIKTAVAGEKEPAAITKRGGIHIEQKTISKASAITNVEVVTSGFNLVQVSSDGDLSDVTYTVTGLDGNESPAIPANLSPHVVGHHKKITVTSSETEVGKSVYVTMYLAPWVLLPAIMHGTPQSSVVASASRLFYAEKVEYASGSDNFFETDQPLGTTPNLSMTGTPSDAIYIRIDTIKYQFTFTNAVTFQLYLLEDAQAVDERSESDVFYDSGSGLASGTMYIETGGASEKLSIMIKLATAATIYRLLDHSGAPGDTTGYIKLYGEVLT